jgi:hypothetical protein
MQSIQLPLRISKGEILCFKDVVNMQIEDSSDPWTIHCTKTIILASTKQKLMGKHHMPCDLVHVIALKNQIICLKQVRLIECNVIATYQSYSHVQLPISKWDSVM